MKQNGNENAASPVIGTILMVSIVVILAAVVAAFVFGMSGQTKAGHNIGIKTEYNSGSIVATYYGGDGQNTLTGISVTLNDVQQADWLPAQIGESHIYPGAYTKPTKALIVAHYSDGGEYIVLNENI